MIIVDRFSQIKLVENYVHLYKKNSNLRITLPIHEILDRYDAALHGKPALSKDGLSIEFPDSSVLLEPISIPELIPSQGARHGLSDIQLISCSSISGVHPVYLEILKATDTDLITKSTIKLDEEALKLATFIQPLLLHLYKGEIYCFGNIAAYNAAVSYGLDIDLWARTYTKKAAKSFFRSLIITEIYTQPLLSQTTSKTASTLYWFQKNILDHQSYNEEFKRLHRVNNSKAKFARLFGLDPRSIK